MRVLPAEWHRQRAVLMAFPHENSDWKADLQASLSPFIRIAQAIAYSQPVYILCQNRESISNLFCSTRNMSFIEIPTKIHGRGITDTFQLLKMGRLNF